MFEESGKLDTGAMERGDSRGGSLTEERPKETDEITRRLRMLPPELTATAMRALGSGFDANEASTQEGIELATQIVNSMTRPEVYTVKALQLHIRQCDALDALQNYRNAREELRRSATLLTRRCLRTLESQLESGGLSADLLERGANTLSAAG